MTTKANAGSIGNQELNVTIIAGQDQTAIVGQPFNEQFTVRLTDDKGLPYSNVDVSFQNNICSPLGEIGDRPRLFLDCFFCPSFDPNSVDRKQWGESKLAIYFVYIRYSAL